MRSVPLLLVVAYCVSLSLLLTACKPAPQNTPVQTAPVAESPTPTANTAEYTCVLKVGFDAWEPYHYLGQGQQIVGLDIDILQALASELSCDLQLEQDTWTTLLSRLQAGELDLLPGASRSSDSDSLR